MNNYNYDHLIKKLVNEYGWLRVPWWIPGTDTHRLEGIAL